MHTCPACGQACYCNGDIDDIDAELEIAICCTHCPDGAEDDDTERTDEAAADFDPFADNGLALGSSDILPSSTRTAAEDRAFNEID